MDKLGKEIKINKNTLPENLKDALESNNYFLTKAKLNIFNFNLSKKIILIRNIEKYFIQIYHPPQQITNFFPQNSPKQN